MPAAAAGVPGSTLDTTWPLWPRTELIARPNLWHGRGDGVGRAAWGGGVGRAAVAAPRARQPPWAKLTSYEPAAP